MTLNSFKKFASSNVNIILAFLIVNFLTIATLIGVQAYYFSIAQEQRELQTNLMSRADKILQIHNEQNAAIKARQDAIIANQKHILMAEEFFKQSIYNETKRDNNNTGAVLLKLDKLLNQSSVR